MAIGRRGRWAIGLLAVVVVLLAGLAIAARMALNTDAVPAGAVQKSVTSRDGTVIAYEQSGAGLPVVLVGAALVDRGGTRRLAAHLSGRFTVLNYDRRGRGASTDTPPYAAAREIEDLEAMLEAAGGHAFLFGSSSGAVLALDAAAKLGSKVTRLYVYEPPLIVDGSHPPVAVELGPRIARLAAAGQRDDAVAVFFEEAMGIPGGGVKAMRYLMPGWGKMAAIAHTAPYDLAVLAGTQSGTPVAADRWAAVTAPVRVAVGSRSEPFFHSGARALAAMLPAARYERLDGRDHSAILFAAGALADSAAVFFAGDGK